VNRGDGTFEERSEVAGLADQIYALNVTRADIDNDGDLDVLMMTNGGPPALFRNEGVANRSLRIKLVGTRSNRDGLGTVVTVKTGGDQQRQMLRSGSSYLSANELVLTFGLAQHTQADSIEVRWSSGQVDHLGKIAAGQTITLKEGGSIVQQRPYGTVSVRVAANSMGRTGK
jgi:hypothetical protein